MILLSRQSRPVRAGDWSQAKAVTFIVTLAATRRVTLAASASGMSRKAAYDLRDRDPGFAEAWSAALSARPLTRQGYKVEEVQDTPDSPGQGNNIGRVVPSDSALRARRRAERERDAYFARLAPRACRKGSFGYPCD